MTWGKFCCTDESEWKKQLSSQAQQTHGAELWKHHPSLLGHYIVHTFETCHRQQKLQCFESVLGTLTIFNTGLVDQNWEEIHGAFIHFSSTAPEWKWHSFMKASSSRKLGFTGELQRAFYFDDPSSLILDLRGNQAFFSFQACLALAITEASPP